MVKLLASAVTDGLTTEGRLGGGGGACGTAKSVVGVAKSELNTGCGSYVIGSGGRYATGGFGGGANRSPEGADLLRYPGVGFDFRTGTLAADPDFLEVCE